MLVSFSVFWSNEERPSNFSFTVSNAILYSMRKSETILHYYRALICHWPAGRTQKQNKEYIKRRQRLRESMWLLWNSPRGFCHDIPEIGCGGMMVVIKGFRKISSRLSVDSKTSCGLVPSRPGPVMSTCTV